jgi:hypothetical protein
MLSEGLERKMNLFIFFSKAFEQQFQASVIIGVICVQLWTFLSLAFSFFRAFVMMSFVFLVFRLCEFLANLKSFVFS